MGTATVETRFQSALALHQQGEVARAVAIYEAILAHAPDHPGANHLLGAAIHQQGDPEAALGYLEKAISLCDAKAVYWNNYGAALRGVGRLKEAMDAFVRATDINTSYADAWANRGVVLLDVGKVPAALRALHRALELQPNHPRALKNAGDGHRALGRAVDAIDHYERAVALTPSDGELWRRLGELYLSERRDREALDACQRAVRLLPDSAEAKMLLSLALAADDRVEEARSEQRKASNLRPDDGIWRWRHLGFCPTVFSSSDAIDEYRRGLEGELDRALEESPRFDWKRLGNEGFFPPFELAHHGVASRAIKEKYARLFAPAFPHEPPSPRNASRPRIGFVVPPGREAGFLRCSRILIDRMDGDRFEIVVLCAANKIAELKRRITREDIQWTAFPLDFAAAVSAIRDVECDILYHHQIGTDSFNYFLPYARCAPIQCTGWFTHGTSGLPVVDSYLSSRLMEDESAQVDYTESLRLFETFPTCQSRPPKLRMISRSEMCLPSTGALYFCPQRIHKLLPSFDRLLRRILEEDATGHVLLIKGPNPAIFGRLARRLEGALGRRLLQRIHWLPWLETEHYHQLLMLADVVLDTPNYSASLTGHDAFARGTPVVTMPGTLNVGRYALGFYRRMGVLDCIAESEEQYVATAVRLARDREFSRHVRSMIHERSSRLFEDETAVRDHEAYFADCWSRRAEYCGKH